MRLAVVSNPIESLWNSMFTFFMCSGLIFPVQRRVRRATCSMAWRWAPNSEFLVNSYTNTSSPWSAITCSISASSARGSITEGGGAMHATTTCSSSLNDTAHKGIFQPSGRFHWPDMSDTIKNPSRSAAFKKLVFRP